MELLKPTLPHKRSSISVSIEQAVMQIKHDVSKAFDAAAIVLLCRSIGYSWRTRQFDPVATIQGFLLQVLHGNTACSHVPRLLGASTFFRARNGRFVHALTGVGSAPPEDGSRG